MTPEGRIKQKIKTLLDSYGKNLYYYMPVPGGYGGRTIDYLGCIKGVFFGIEAKKPGGKPTAMQGHTLLRIGDAGGYSLVVHDEETLTELKRWLDSAMKIVEWRVYP